MRKIVLVLVLFSVAFNCFCIETIKIGKRTYYGFKSIEQVVMEFDDFSWYAGLPVESIHVFDFESLFKSQHTSKGKLSEQHQLYQFMINYPYVLYGEFLDNGSTMIVGMTIDGNELYLNGTLFNLTGIERKLEY